MSIGTEVNTMKKTIEQNARGGRGELLRGGLLVLLATALSACGNVDSTDGEVRNTVTLPQDSVLSLFCPDAGIGSETCILSDPDNPYANTNVLAANPNDGNAEFKWALEAAAPSWKARFYVWATAQAMSPQGENQYHVALALQGMYAESGSELARQQALKAYKSVLDNYYDDVWFFKFPTPPAQPTLFQWPKKVRLLSVDNLWDDSTDDNPLRDSSVNFPLVPLFDSELAALEAIGEWGYTFEAGTGEITRNF
jgi:hypothetical protein